MRAQTFDATCAAFCSAIGRLSPAECVRLDAAGCGGAELMTVLIRVWA